MRKAGLPSLLVSLGVGFLLVLLIGLAVPKDIAKAEGAGFWRIVSRKQVEKPKVILVPGHNLEHPGAKTGDYTELELNVALAHALKDMVVHQGYFDVLVTHNQDGSIAPWLESYLDQNKEDIADFISESKGRFGELIEREVITHHQGIDHNYAPDDLVEVLYGINMLANEQEADLVLHIHFNDVPKGSPHYQGYSIYVPERQFPNFRESKSIAESISRHLSQVVNQSSHPLESATVIEDQQLIAVGAYGTREGASILVEYAYIYEPMLKSDENRAYVIKELALQTYLGLFDHFR